MTQKYAGTRVVTISSDACSPADASIEHHSGSPHNEVQESWQQARDPGSQHHPVTHPIAPCQGLSRL